MNIKNDDVEFGLRKENEYYELLKNTFDNTLEKMNNKYNIFDFIGEKCYIELKSRRNAHNKYPDTMIGNNKIQFAKFCNHRVIFCFSFTDGLYYYEFNKNDNLKLGNGGRNDRGKDEYKDYVFIPIILLRKII